MNLLKYKLLQAYLSNIASNVWHPGDEVVPANYYFLNIKNLYHNNAVTIQNKATDYMKEKYDEELNDGDGWEPSEVLSKTRNSKNLYYIISTRPIHNWKAENLTDDQSSYLSTLKWNPLGDGILRIDSSCISPATICYVYLTAKYNTDNYSIWNNGRSIYDEETNPTAASLSAWRYPVDIDLEILPINSSDTEVIINCDGSFESLIFGTDPKEWDSEFINNWEYKGKNSYSIPVPRFTGSSFTTIKNFFNKKLTYTETFSDCTLGSSAADFELSLGEGTLCYGIFNGSNLTSLTINPPIFDYDPYDDSYLSRASLGYIPFGDSSNIEIRHTYLDRFGKYGSFNTSSLKNITLNLDTGTEGGEVKVRNNWSRIEDFSMLNGSYLDEHYTFAGINDFARILINTRPPNPFGNSNYWIAFALPSNFYGSIELPRIGTYISQFKPLTSSEGRDSHIHRHYQSSSNEMYGPYSFSGSNYAPAMGSVMIDNGSVAVVQDRATYWGTFMDNQLQLGTDHIKRLIITDDSGLKYAPRKYEIDENGYLKNIIGVGTAIDNGLGVWLGTPSDVDKFNQPFNRIYLDDPTKFVATDDTITFGQQYQICIGAATKTTSLDDNSI